MLVYVPYAAGGVEGQELATHQPLFKTIDVYDIINK
jgi:hypothetical protein